MNANKLYFSLFLTILLLFGCAKTNDSDIFYTNTFYNQQQITVLFMSTYRIAPVLADESYRQVKKAAIKSHWNKYKQELFNKGVANWDNSFDCNRFTLYFQAFSQIEYFKTSNGSNSSVAIGEVFYLKDGISGHAINCALTDSGLIFIEPQTGQVLNLTKKELDSIFFVKF